MTRLLKNIQNKIEILKHLWDYCKWLIRQYHQPRPIGTQFEVIENNYIITFEVIGHIPGNRPQEMISEIQRKIRN